MRHFPLVLILFATILLTGCDKLLHFTAPAPEADATFDAQDLSAELRAAGATVELGGQISQPFFTVAGQVLTVSGENLQVFRYSDQAAAVTASAIVSSDGSLIGASRIDWIGTPHFYRRGVLIVLYVGDNFELTQLLMRILGPQFAGGITFPEI